MARMVGPMVGPLQTPERRPRAADAAITTIIDAVLSGTHPPGSVLPAERELAAELGISRTTLRQAITRLQQLGVVESRQGRGTVVLDVEASTHPDLVARLVDRHGPGLLAELFEVREAMGTLAGRLAAERATTAELESLGRAVEQVRSASDATTCQRAELAFFVLLVDASHNRPLRTMLRWTEQAYGSAGHPFTAAFEHPAAIAEDLERVLAVVRAREPGAAADEMARYAEVSGRRMLQVLGLGGTGRSRDASSG